MMKKIFTLCIGLMGVLSSWAQGFEFQYQGQGLADGATVIIAAEEDLFGDLSCETNSAMNPTDGLMMKLLSSTTATASATIEVTYNTLNANMLQWCMGGECTPMNGRTSLTKRFTVNGQTQVQFDAIGIANEGYLMATLKVIIGLESHTVKILFINGDYDSIKAIDKIDNEKGILYDLNGRKVQGRPSPGIYIVTDGTHTRKMAIK